MGTPKVRSGSSSGSGPGTLRCPSCNAVYTPPLENCPSCGEELPKIESLVGPGSVIDNKYEIIQLLGAGGMGEVYKARHVHLNAIRTVKVLRPGLLADSWFKNRFLREARLATQVSHANLAVVHDFSILPNGSCYMVSEFVDGLTVRQWIKRFGRFPLGLAVEIVSQALAGLVYCHRRGLLHRDMSPDNIMITVDSDDRPIVKIIDLGIAKQLGGRSVDATQTGLFVGNPKYCSPEQLGHLEEGQEIDARADIYSLGIALYEMVAGEPPFRSTTPHGYFIKHLTQAPPNFDETDPGLSVPKEFQRVLFKALEKDRSRRYSSAEEFAAALRPFAEDISRGLDATYGITLRETSEDDDRPTAKIPPRLRTEPGTATDYRRTKELEGEAVANARRDETGRKEESHALALVRDLESRRDLQGLEALAASWPVDSRVARDAAGAIGRVSVLAAREKRETEATDWDHAWNDGVHEAWQEFLDRHPDSPRRTDAMRHQAEARDLHNALESESQDALHEFLRAWPEGRFHEQVAAKIEEARAVEAEALDRAQTLGTAQAFREFLERHPRSFLGSLAQTFLDEQVAFDEACAAETLEGWQRFLSRWPSGRNSAPANTRRRLLEEREERALSDAVATGTSAALKEFLERHTASRSRPRAEALFQEAASWEKARGGSHAAVDEFLREYPDGSHADAARAELRRLEEEAQLDRVREFERAGELSHLDRIVRAHAPSSVFGSEARAAIGRLADVEWKKACRQNTEAAFEHFLRNHAVSSYADEAGERLQKLRAEREARLLAEQQAAREREERMQAELRSQREREERRQAELRAQKELEETKRAELAVRLERERLEEGRWKKASKQNTEDAWAEFLERHTDSARAARAREKLEQIRAEREAKALAEKEAVREQEKRRQAEHAEDEPTRVLAVEAHPEKRAEKLILGDVDPIEASPIEQRAPEGGRLFSPRTIVIGGLLAAVVVVVLFAVSRTERHGKAPVPRPAETTAKPPVAEAGLLAVDVLPWGRVERIEDRNGQNWLQEPAYTPFAVHVPAGHYSIRITSANFPGRTLTLAADVQSGGAATCQGRFEIPNAQAYFEAEGWR